MFAKFAGLLELWLQIISLKLIVRSLKGHCLDHQFFGFIDRIEFR